MLVPQSWELTLGADLKPDVVVVDADDEDTDALALATHSYMRPRLSLPELIDGGGGGSLEQLLLTVKSFSHGIGLSFESPT